MSRKNRRNRGRGQPPRSTPLQQSQPIAPAPAKDLDSYRFIPASIIQLWGRVVAASAFSVEWLRRFSLWEFVIGLFAGIVGQILMTAGWYITSEFFSSQPGLPVCYG